MYIKPLVVTSYHNHKVLIIATPRPFLPLLFVQSDFKPNPNHTANFMPHLKFSPRKTFFFTV